MEIQKIFLWNMVKVYFLFLRLLTQKNCFYQGKAMNVPNAL